MDYKYGELQDWNDADVKTGPGFMRLTEGDNVVRIITQPYQFTVCWIKDPNGNSRKLRSALKNCPLVKRGEKLQNRWYVGVIERRSSTTKILEISSQILSALKNLANDSDWGNPKGYDVNIKRGPAMSQPLYSVIAKPHKPLTEEEKAMAELFVKNTDLAKMTKPPTVEEVQERLAAVEGGRAGVSGGSGVRESRASIDPNLFSYDDDEKL